MLDQPDKLEVWETENFQNGNQSYTLDWPRK